MNEKTILEVASPVAQTVEAVVELLSNLGRTAEPADPTSSTGEWPGSYSGLADKALQEVA